MFGCDLTTNFDPYISKSRPSDIDTIKEVPDFAWNHSQYLGEVKKAHWKERKDFEHHYI